MKELNDISHDIIKTAIALREMGYDVKEELPVPITFRGEIVDDGGFRIDLLVDDKVIVELKSVEEIKPVFSKQLGTYLKLADKNLGLLINFNVVVLKDGIKRIVNNFQEQDSYCPQRSEESFCKY